MALIKQGVKMDLNIKQDINFLEYPIWMQTERNSSDVLKFTDMDGYIFEAAGGVPAKVDILILYFLFLTSQQKKWSQRISLSRYAILTACGITISKQNYNRLEEALQKWKRVTISFSGTFYSGKRYSTLEFGVIDDWGFQEESGFLEIRLNEKWIEKTKASEYFKYISFDQMKQLRSPLALRLYEILTKTFYKRETWEIDVLKLAAKIPMDRKYFADIVPKIEAATRRIAEKTDLKLTVETVKQGRGKGKFIFTRKEKSAPPGELFTPPETPPSEIPFDLLNLIPEEWRENAISEANKIFKIAGEGELKACISRINQAIKKGTEINSYGGYLRRCHDEKWHLQKNPKVIKSEKEAIVREKSDLKRVKVEVDRQEEQTALKAQHEALNRLQIEDPDRYAQLEQQAADALGLNLKKPGRGGKLKITRQMFKLMEKP